MVVESYLINQSLSNWHKLIFSRSANIKVFKSMIWDRNVWKKLSCHFVSKSGDVMVGLFASGQNAVKRNVEITSP